MRIRFAFFALALLATSAVNAKLYEGQLLDVTTFPNGDMLVELDPLSITFQSGTIPACHAGNAYTFVINGTEANRDLIRETITAAITTDNKISINGSASCGSANGAATQYMRVSQTVLYR